MFELIGSKHEHILTEWHLDKLYGESAGLGENIASKATWYAIVDGNQSHSAIMYGITGE